MDDAQKDLRAFLERWRVDQDQSDVEIVQQLMEAATHYAPRHARLHQLISETWRTAIFGNMEPLGPEFERVWDDNIDKLYE